MYEQETLQFWELLFKENSNDIIPDKTHYRKKKVILKKLANLYKQKIP